MRFTYHVVDVFTRVALEGNALAVFSDARGLATSVMQRIAREINLSETTFVFTPDDPTATPRVRIFTPLAEMDFAGHPTIGTAYVLRQLHALPQEVRDIVLRENIGPVSVRIGDEEEPILWMKTPPIRAEGKYDSSECARALNLGTNELLAHLPCELLTAGNPSVFVPLNSREAVDRAAVDIDALQQLLKGRKTPTCIFVFTPTAHGAYSRMFAPALGIVEDPASGSVTGPLAAYMMKHGLVSDADRTRFISEQGTKMGRRSFLHVLVHGERGSSAIEVGGNVAPFAVAEVNLTIEPSLLPTTGV